MPLPTIEETGSGVMAIIQRKMMDDVIAKRGANVGDFVGDFQNHRKGLVGDAESRHNQARGQGERDKKLSTASTDYWYLGPVDLYNEQKKGDLGRRDRMCSGLDGDTVTVTVGYSFF